MTPNEYSLRPFDLTIQEIYVELLGELYSDHFKLIKNSKFNHTFFSFVHDKKIAIPSCRLTNQFVDIL